MRGLTLIVVVAALATAPAASSRTHESATPTGRIAYAPRFYPKDNWEISP
ncbi:MAG: hypothetical protein ACRDNH_04295 [Gaiellaceae bacterium]